MAVQMSEYLGKLTLQGVSALGRWAVFSVRALREVRSGQALGTRLVRALFEQGVRCVPVIAVVAAFTGMVLGLQGHYVLSRFGATGMLGTLVSLSLCRELGPVLAALMIAGQAGTALSAELGIQRSTEQIDAIELMDVSPEGFLVGARLVGAFFVFPVLTAFFVLIGVAGGWLSGCVLMPQDSNSYWGAVHEAIRGKDIRECLLKAAVFGFLTTALCAYQGFYAHRSGEAGARAVGLATVRGIVLSSIAILAADYLITAVLL
jgi:phospholipid/cholesterol/gamma-HCH transport system permease protein